MAKKGTFFGFRGGQSPACNHSHSRNRHFPFGQVHHTAGVTNLALVMWTKLDRVRMTK